MLRFIIACYVVCLVTGSQAFAQATITLTDLRARVQAIESAWRRCSAEIIETNWAPDGRQTGSSCRDYILLGNHYREHHYKLRELGGRSPQFTIRQWDGSQEKQVTPLKHVDLRDKPTDLPPPSLPYGVILRIAGLGGGLSDFLEEQREPPLKAEVSLIAVKSPRICVRRRVRLPDTDESDVIKIEFDSAQGLRPISLHRYRQSGDGEGTARANELQLNVTKAVLATDAVRYDVRIVSTASPTKASTKSAMQRIRGRKIDAGLALPQIAIAEFMGNPAVRTHDGKQTTEVPLLAVDQPSAPPWSVFDKWLLINNVLVAALVFFWLLSKLVGVAKRWVSRKTAADHAEAVS